MTPADLAKVPQHEALKPKQSGPRPCCADAAIVIVCDGDTDTWECWVCGRTWEAPCR